MAGIQTGGEMAMNIRIKEMVIVTLSAIVLTGCATQIGLVGGGNRLAAKSFSIKLVPQGNSGVLQVHTANKGCVNNPHNGCIRFAKDTVGLVQFYLPGSRKTSKTCDDKGVKAVITGIQLTTTGSGEKGDFSVLPDPWLKNEAILALDLADGYAYEADKTVATTQVWLLNANFNDAADGVKTFWYRVTAESCSDAKGTWVTDPRMENDGTTQ